MPPNPFPRRPVAVCRALPRLLALCLSLLAGSWASAAGGPTIAVTAAPTGAGTTLNAQVHYPLLAWDHHQDTLQLALRADVNYLMGSRALPALGLSALLSGHGDAAPGVERYLGLGGGLAFAAEPLASPFPAAYLFTGVRAPVTAGLSVVVELQLGATGLVLTPGGSVGLAYRFGAAR